MKIITGFVLFLLLASCHHPDSSGEQKHLIHDYPARIDSVWVNMVVEIPAGSSDKWEVNKGTGELEWEQVDGIPRVVNYLAYPANYGFIPQTLLDAASGGDGDPLDVLALGAAVQRGAVIPVKIIGMLRMQDSGEHDDKLIGIMADSPFKDVDCLEDLIRLYPGVTGIIETWFGNYKGTDRVNTSGFATKDEAIGVLSRAVSDYRLNK